MNIYDASKILGISGEITPEITKKAYREASKKFHPDINPAGLEMMKIINEAYDALKTYKGFINPPKQATSESFGELLNNALNVVLDLEGLDVEVCGSWIWITGNTKAHKAELKKAGFYWASKKLAWYFRPPSEKSFSRGKKTLEEIRETYGSVKPTKVKRTALAN